MDEPGEQALATQVTGLLARLGEGDSRAADELLPLLYTELRGAAQRCMLDERMNHTLQPTALVHEAFLRLVARPPSSPLEGRAHFLRIAARAMRQVLVDHARARRAQKRGEGGGGLAVDEWLEELEERSLDVLEVQDALVKLEAVDAELARLVEARFFAGMTIEETALAMQSSTATVERSWRVARAWMRRELG